MDKIIIQGLQVNSLIGVYDWEREAKQPIIVDITMQLDLSRAADSDDVADTIDYAQAAQKLADVADKSEFQLLEALAGHMIQAMFDAYPVLHITLRLTKPNILDNAQQVAVELSRDA